MKIKFVSFTDFSSELEVYNLKKMDLFVYLLTKVINTGSDKTVKEILLDLDITKDLMYLFENNFYYLLDNGLIEVSVEGENIDEIKASEIKFSEFGNYCLRINTVPEFNEKVDKRIIYNPFIGELVSENKTIHDSNVVVCTEDVDYLTLINKYKKEIMSIYNDDFILNYSKVEKNPFYYEVNVNSLNIDSKYRKYLLENRVSLEENKEIDEDKKEFLSSNFKVDIFYGKERNLINSNYSLVVDEEKKFTVDMNKVYVSNIIDEFDNYSFIGIEDSVIGYDVGSVIIDDIKCSCIRGNKLKNYKSEIKKYLLKNRDKYSDSRVVNEIIDLL